jgi:hypothetical protein
MVLGDITYQIACYAREFRVKMIRIKIMRVAEEEENGGLIPMQTSLISLW